MPGPAAQIASIPCVPGGLKSRQFHLVADVFTPGTRPLIVVNVLTWYLAKPGASAKALRNAT